MLDNEICLFIQWDTVNAGNTFRLKQKTVHTVYAKERAPLKDTGDSANLEVVVEETLKTKAVNSVILILTQFLRGFGIKLTQEIMDLQKTNKEKLVLIG